MAVLGLNQLLCGKLQGSPGAPLSGLTKHVPLFHFLLPALSHSKCFICQCPILMNSVDLKGLCPWSLLSRWSHCHTQVQPPKATSRPTAPWPVTCCFQTSQSTNAHSSGWILLKNCLPFHFNSLHFSLFITPNEENILPVMSSCNMKASYLLPCILPSLFLPLPHTEKSLSSSPSQCLNHLFTS